MARPAEMPSIAPLKVALSWAAKSSFVRLTFIVVGVKVVR